MKFKAKEILFILIIIIAFVIAGFLRDAIFMSINSQLYKLYFKNYDYTLPSWLSYFDSWPYMKLYYFKYWLTAGFILLYFLLSILSLRLVVGSYSKSKWVIYAYGIIIFLSILTYMGGYFLNNFPKGFLFTRNMIGLLQSPFITMVVIPALKLEENKSLK
ncbi:MAG: hypothetical protein IT238_05055 [Bacteroidia bacterium]|nr:hypothetical protein [Bacteroidia bacterium]MCZ2248337.1 hypothetical protein [Bacteroidia bacterium]